MHQHEDYLQINSYIHQSIGTIFCETENRGVKDQYLYFQDSWWIKCLVTKADCHWQDSLSSTVFDRCD